MSVKEAPGIRCPWTKRYMHMKIRMKLIMTQGWSPLGTIENESILCSKAQVCRYQAEQALERTVELEAIWHHHHIRSPNLVINAKSWRSCNNPTSNWPHQGHKVPYLIILSRGPPMPALWPDSDPRTHAPGVYSVTTQSWWILHCWLTRDPLWDSPRGLHSRVSERSWILLSNMNGHIPRRTPNLN